MALKTSTIFLAGVVLSLLAPPLIFFGCALVSGLGVGGAGEALVAQYLAPRQNLFVLSAVGLLPLALLALLLWIWGRLAPATPRPTLAVAGLFPILCVNAWPHFQFWPLFLPKRTYPGFPHGLEFVIGPLFFAPVAMIVALGIAALVTRSRT